MQRKLTSALFRVESAFWHSCKVIGRDNRLKVASLQERDQWVKTRKSNGPIIRLIRGLVVNMVSAVLTPPFIAPSDGRLC